MRAGSTDGLDSFARCAVVEGVVRPPGVWPGVRVGVDAASAAAASTALRVAGAEAAGVSGVPPVVGYGDEVEFAAAVEH